MQDEATVKVKSVIVYDKPAFSADSIYTLMKYESVIVGTVEDDTIFENVDWKPVEISRNKYSNVDIESSIASFDDFFISGFVPVYSIETIDSLQKYDGKGIELIFSIVKADTTQVPSKTRLQYGLEIPLSLSYTVSDLYLRWNGELIQQDSSLFDDLYNVQFHEGNYSSSENPNFKFYTKDDIIYIKQECGDGAGAYEITWVIWKGKIVQRLIDQI